MKYKTVTDPEIVKTIIWLYTEEFYSIHSTSIQVGYSYNKIRATLIANNIPLRKTNYSGTKLKEAIKYTPTSVDPKYKDLIEEPLNEGKSYKEYCKQFNVKVPTAWFGTIRKKRASVEKL